MQRRQVPAGPLEDRLRDMILTHSDHGTGPSNSSLSQPHGLPLVEAQPPPATNAPHQKGGKKRPNQAQRRQMNLSIPVDPRPPPPQPRRHAGEQPFSNGQFRHDNSSLPLSYARQPAAYRGELQMQAFDVNTSSHPPGPRHREGLFSPAAPSSMNSNDWRQQQFNGFARGHQSRHTLYKPGGHHQPNFGPLQIMSQVDFMDRLCGSVLPNIEITLAEIAEKEGFRCRVEAICRHAITQHDRENGAAIYSDPSSVQLKCFGSLASGYATKAADMDLGLLSPMSWNSIGSPDSPIPRLVEKALLDAGLGARLLTKTRVPIIKLCELPGDQLWQSLVDQRTRWEKGIHDEDPDADEDILEDHTTPDGASTVHSDVPQSPTKAQRLGSQDLSGIHEGTTDREKLASLRQQNKQSLVSYYGKTRNLLHRLNGRDVTNATWTGFTQVEFILLDSVSSAFIDGLCDQDLKYRILCLPSFRASSSTLGPNCRSLCGALRLAEGETIVRMLEKTAPQTGSLQFQQDRDNLVAWWKSLQQEKCFGSDPMLFNKELQLVLERLRQLPAVQLTQLRQEPYEAPNLYYARVIKLITGTLVQQMKPTSTDTLPEAIEYYINGIRDGREREEVRLFASSSKVLSARSVSRKHQAIHLAASYERAIEQGLYPQNELPLLKKYISILRSDLTQASHHPNDFIIPVTKDHIRLLDVIKLMADPSTLAPNQPKGRYQDVLPKSGVGVQCDINFSATLALQNTLLLRCYSHTDPRVRPMILFVKHWAKVRDINTPYRGTLSSYGYVLMVLHYLVNIATPFVCPNLQELGRGDPNLPSDAFEAINTGVNELGGRDVRFWRDEGDIQRLASQGLLNQNTETIGSLLRGFFEYYAQGNFMSAAPKRGFHWGREALSLRSHGGLVLKTDKGWTGAKVVIQPQAGPPPNPAEPETTTQIGQMHPEQPSSPDKAAGLTPSTSTTTTGGDQAAKRPKEVKEVRHRYLLAIEDPFELEHNVARTVTHNGIVAIRDEFRRAWRIIQSAGAGVTTGGGGGGSEAPAAEDLMEDVKLRAEMAEKRQFAELLQEIHGTQILMPESVGPAAAVLR
ncbi:hypothetical protein GGR56DRAFT_618775 [Xylariaceae sp. FL0804]|nr:hypothetical protein GGR56DRAFT_618775 [Xylariaceae sp. FL0804]